MTSDTEQEPAGCHQALHALSQLVLLVQTECQEPDSMHVCVRSSCNAFAAPASIQGGEPAGKALLCCTAGHCSTYVGAVQHGLCRVTATGRYLKTVALEGTSSMAQPEPASTACLVQLVQARVKASGQPIDMLLWLVAPAARPERLQPLPDTPLRMT